jgi:hypothetical protein
MRWLSLLCLLGCEAAAPTGPELIPGFTPPAATTGELQIVSPAVRNIAAGANVMYCSYLDLKLAPTDVLSFHGLLSSGGHHLVLYVARQKRPVDTHLCTEDDMINVKYLAGVGADNTLANVGQLPEGVAFRVPEGAQLMVQTHFINASLKSMDGQGAINLVTATPSDARQPADLFTVVNDNFVIPAGQMFTAETTCTVGEDLKIFFLSGHAHALARQVRMDLMKPSGATMLYDTEWQPEYEFNPPVSAFTVDAPLILKAGDQVRTSCTWDNTAGAKDLRFPDEMCAGLGFYFPGHGELDCVNGSWPQ